MKKSVNMVALFVVLIWNMVILTGFSRELVHEPLVYYDGKSSMKSILTLRKAGVILRGTV